MSRLRHLVLAVAAVLVLTAPVAVAGDAQAVGHTGPAGPAAHAQRSGSSYVTLDPDDRQSLLLHDQPFKFVGWNNYQLTSTPGGFTCGRAISDKALGAVLDNAKATGATVVRTWFFQSYYHPKAKAPFSQFNRVLRAAHARGLKVIPVLTNEEGACQTQAKLKVSSFYSSGYKKQKYGDSLTFAKYAALMATTYQNTPTIAFWQLVNEARVVDLVKRGKHTKEVCATNAAGKLRGFADAMGKIVHDNDPHHLVSLGTIGSGQCGARGTEYTQVYSSPWIDLCEYHDYSVSGSSDYKTPITDDGHNRLRQRLDQCAALDKPLFIGEAALVATIKGNGGAAKKVTAASLDRRATYFKAKLSAAFANLAVGYVLWEKIPDASGSSYNLTHGQYGVGPKDPLNAVVKAQAQRL